MNRLTFCIALFVTGLAHPGAVSLAVPAQTVSLQQESEERPARRGPGRGEGQQREPGIKPYEEVITEEAVTQEGVFKVHRIKDKLFYEIPKSELGKEFVLVSRIAKNAPGVGYGGQKLGTRVVRWDREEDRVLLRSVSYSIVASEDLPVSRAVGAANNPVIVRAFNVRAEGPDDSSVIEVSDLYTTDVFELSAKTRLQARGMDAKRSFLGRVTAFPRNIEVRATHTYTKPADSTGSQNRRPAPRSRFRRGMDPGSASVVLHHSMVKLPENPMKPRLYDERVGYFSVQQYDYGREEHRAEERRYITRWRLEKKDPDAQLSEPVQPIVYWIDSATPTKWVPYMKKGVEDWQVAFEEAGFKNAIVAREAPTPQQDPTWDPEDARYSVIRWLPSTIQNASGPHVHDPRTGEILETDIQFYHNIQNLLTSWYFLQVGPLDPRARKLPLPDDLMGELLRYVVAHEVGHTLGFPHNMKASSMYGLDQVRDPEWVREMGHVATLMDYSRFNYVAQPEDGIPPEDLVPKVGPYDRWATMWGYKPIPEAQTPDDEKAVLNQWALAQEKTPWLRFSTPDADGSDPGALTEAVGDADAVRATALGVKNLRRVADMLLTATAEPGDNWDLLEEFYGGLLGQWTREMGHVAALVGGFLSQQRHAGQEGVRFQPVSPGRQAEAVRFLNDNAFQTPDFFIRPDILRRIEPSGALARMGNAQRRLLNSLLNEDRVTRLVEQETLDSDNAYRAEQFLSDLRGGLWSELESDQVSVDAFRRNVQRFYLEILDSRLNGANPVSGDARALFRAQLRALADELATALPKVSDPTTQSHLEDARDSIARTLDPKFAPTQSSSQSGQRRGVEDEDPGICWPELIIRP